MKLKSLNLDYGFKMVSFNVTALYPSIPLNMLFEFMNTIDYDTVGGLTMSKIISLTKLCVLDNEFAFEGTWYAQVLDWLWETALVQSSLIHLWSFLKNIY